MKNTNNNVKLKRSLSLPLLTFYGLGTIIGAGIYVLVGEVAGKAGLYAPFSFLLAAIIASFTGISYAELSARHPKSAGEAVYVEQAFHKKLLSTIVGLLIVITGLVSSATLVNGFTGYFRLFLQIPNWLIITSLIIVLGFIAIWGIVQSAIAATIITIIEIGGLLLILFSARDFFLLLPTKISELIPPLEGTAWTGITLGAFIAFYAFIGFEDMVNVAEEVKKPQRTLPKAIFLAVAGATILYVLVSLITVLVLPVSKLVGNGAPLAEVYQQTTGNSPKIIGLISLFAIVNGILIQIIMASRVLYGLSSQKWLPKILGKVSPKTQTPIISTILVLSLILVLALWLPLVTLAQATSFIVLTIFMLINLALIKLKRKNPNPKGVATYSIVIPIMGFVLSFLFITFQLANII